VTNVDDGERVLADDLEPAGPARRAQAGADSGFDWVRRPAWRLALQPQQKKRNGDGRIVDLERPGQAQFEAAEIMISELKIEMLP
jgi:hypothetical protein